MSSPPHLSMYLSRSLCCSYIWSMIILQSSISLRSSSKPSPPIPPTENWTQGLVLVRLSYSPTLKLYLLCSSQQCLLLRQEVQTTTITADTLLPCKQSMHCQAKDRPKGRLGLFTDAISFVSLQKPGEISILPLFLRERNSPRDTVSHGQDTGACFSLKTTSKILSLQPNCSIWTLCTCELHPMLQHTQLILKCFWLTVLVNKISFVLSLC